ncbi:hypothetical protein MAPG_03472 [Magnaporthiopsis poae ATCC 64411]|uniref:Uncharacterized protein n=1 Tax=Magnaporthiopsis poae (strain ATCC 64411 / 73-15) TaxID=644358 RepID=A0A0C4DU38_MAGP6|nr:hypothetical protein MAPG_03472 [Magnaporthiopsis poae ATCC 64411]
MEVSRPERPQKSSLEENGGGVEDRLWPSMPDLRGLVPPAEWAKSMMAEVPARPRGQGGMESCLVYCRQFLSSYGHRIHEAGSSGLRIFMLSGVDDDLGRGHLQRLRKLLVRPPDTPAPLIDQPERAGGQGWVGPCLLGLLTAAQ